MNGNTDHDKTENPGQEKDPDQAKALTLYLAFISCAILVMSPMMIISFLALVGLLILIAVIGFIRRESEKDSLLYNHATYLSRTFWMWQLLLLTGFIGGGYYLSRQYTGMDQILSLAQELAAGYTDSAGFRMIVNVVIVSFAPGCLYAAYRLIHGLLRILKGYRIARPEKFF